MKIKTWKAWHDPIVPRFADETRNWMADPHPVRIVPEATWRKVMAVVKAAQSEVEDESRLVDPRKLEWSVAALREHERKKP